MNPSITPTRRRELMVTVIVVLGVFVTGVYDFFDRSAPGLFDLGLGPGLALFALTCLGTAATATVLATGSSRHTDQLRVTLVVVALLGSVFADPSYATMLTVAPLIEFRRRGQGAWRTPATLGVLAAVVVLILTENVLVASNEIESRLGLAIAFLMVILLGDALREVDRQVVTEAQVARLSERERLAEDIHDSLGHHLLAASVQLESARALHHQDPDASAAAVAKAASAVAHAVSETRLMVEFGRDREPVVVEPSIHELAELIVPRSTAMQIEVTGNHDSLAPATQMTIYRVVQEGLTNLVRHSAASLASIRSTATTDEVVVEIIDNGDGFDIETVARRSGLSNMRRRVEAVGGDLQVTSGHDGTRLIARVPR